jgi:hypothetical protein
VEDQDATNLNSKLQSIFKKKLSSRPFNELEMNEISESFSQMNNEESR